MRAGTWLCAFVALALTGCASGPDPVPASAAVSDRVVEDHWGREVVLPEKVERAVVMEWEGLVAKSMFLFGIDEAIVGVDTATKKQPFRNHLVPAIANATDIGSAWSGINYESLAALDPDVVFLEAWVASEENRELHATEIGKIEAMGIPVIVFLSPSNFDQPNIATAWEHIEMVGKVFGYEDEAARLVEEMESRVKLIRDRTSTIPEDQKADVVLFATIDNVMGPKSIQSYFLTEIVNANNLVESGTFVTISDEQMLKLNPDTLIVLGHDGYLDPARIYGGEKVGLNWANLAQMDAIANRRLVSLGYDEWRATIETPIGLLKMAKTIYPDRFTDIDLREEELRLYRDVYGMSDDEAVAALEAQEYTGEL